MEELDTIAFIVTALGTAVVAIAKVIKMIRVNQDEEDKQGGCYKKEGKE